MGVGRYSGMGIRTFGDKVKEALNARVDEFVEEILKKDPESVKSKRQWAEQFAHWTKNRQETRDLIEQYLLGNVPPE